MTVSIVICSYNPEERIFARCLRAVCNQDCSGITAELIIVDNNSSPALADQVYIKEAISNSQISVNLINEPTQGLAHARMKGFETAAAPLIVMFDDDNEPESHYLQQAVKAMHAEAAIGILGPGVVTVDYIDATALWIKQQLGAYFQEKKIAAAAFTTKKTMWDEYYPPGTGQVLRRSVTEKYTQSFKAGQLSASDRKGNSLSSSGDNQLIWTALNMGLTVGQDPALQVTHIIPGKRSTGNYLVRLSHALSASGNLALVEMYPDKEAELVKYKWYKYIYHHVKVVTDGLRSGKPRLIPVQLAFLNGKYEASFKYYKQKVPFLYRCMIKHLLMTVITIQITQ